MVFNIYLANYIAHENFFQVNILYHIYAVIFEGLIFHGRQV